MNLLRSVKTLVPTLTITFAILFAASARAQVLGGTRSDEMKATAELIKAQADYERALGEAQLNRAKADYAEAQAMGEFQKARERAVLVNRLEVELRRILKDEVLLRKKAEKVEEHIRIANTILAGRVNLTTLRSLSFLQANAFDAQKVVTTMSEKIDLSIVNELDSGKEAFVGESIGELITYIRLNNLAVKPFGRIQQVVAQALADLSEGSAQKLSSIKNEIEVLRRTQLSTGLPQ